MRILWVLLIVLSGSAFAQETSENEPTFFAHSNSQKFQIRIWADAKNFGTASNIYYDDTIWLAFGDSEVRFEPKKGMTHSGPIQLFASTYPDKTFMAWILWRNQDKYFGNKTGIGKSKATMENCNTPLPCEYYISMKLVN
jgi:hypothetical protein